MAKRKSTKGQTTIQNITQKTKDRVTDTLKLIKPHFHQNKLWLRFMDYDYPFGIFWPLCCLSFLDLWIMITPLVSSNSSYYKKNPPSFYVCVALLSFCFEKTLYQTFHWYFLPNFSSLNFIWLLGFKEDFLEIVLQSSRFVNKHGRHRQF
jgi:hypothetical protein